MGYVVLSLPSHFTDKETEAKRITNMTKVMKPCKQSRQALSRKSVPETV